MSDFRRKRMLKALSQKKKRHQTKRAYTHLDQVEVSDDVKRQVEAALVVQFSDEELKEFADLYTQDITLLMSEESIKEHVGKFRQQATKELRESYLMSQRDHILETVLDRFMLGGLMARGDKDGGPVDTIHNARQGVYATQEAQQAYDQLSDYNSHDYHSHSDYRRVNHEIKNQRERGELTDAYTGRTVYTQQKIDLDHVVSAHEIHNDPGRVLAGLDGPDLANSPSNLQATDASINRSKKQSTMDEFMDRAESAKEQVGRGEEVFDIAQKLSEIDPELARNKDRVAREEIDHKIESTYYTSSDFLQNTGVQALKQGGAMAIRQFIAVYLRELVVSVFDETKDYLRTKSNLKGSWYQELSHRLKRVFSRCRAKWSESLEALRFGGISGLASSLATIIINAFIKTAKNIVRIIREGIFTLIRAVKLLITNPNRLSKNQLYHEVGKLMLSGISFTVGILLEEAIDKTPPMLAIRSIPVIGESIADIVFVFMTALTNGLVLYAWDRLDFFGVNEERIHERVMEMLDREYDTINQNHITWLKSMSQKSPSYAAYLRRECSGWLSKDQLHQLDLS